MIHAITTSNRTEVRTFFMNQWGASQMFVSSGTYDCASLDGFVWMKGSIHGLVTYVIRHDALEIISLDSLQENKGIGSSLLEEVGREAKRHRLKRLTLITTNDNVHALAFYQKRGFRLERIVTDAVNVVRLEKPSIPLIGDNSIPLHDEIVLSKQL